MPVFVEGVASTPDLAPYCYLLWRNEGTKRQRGQRKLASSLYKGANPFMSVLPSVPVMASHCNRMNFLKQEVRKVTFLHTTAR